MFDPNDYFHLVRNRTVCPVHGSRDRNLEIKRNKNGNKWVFNCYSHQCSLKEIALAAGFNASDIYDEGPDGTYINPANYISTKQQPIRTDIPDTTIEDDYRAEWGYNPCTGASAAWTDNEGNGGAQFLPCRKIGCHLCGPRLRWLRHAFTVHEFGTQAWIGTFHKDTQPKPQGDYLRLPHGDGLVTIITDTELDGCTLALVDTGWFNMVPTDGRIFSMGGQMRPRWKALSQQLSLSTNSTSTQRETDIRNWWIPLAAIDISVLIHTLESDGCVVKQSNVGESMRIEWQGDGVMALASVGYVEIEVLQSFKLLPDGYAPVDDPLEVPF